MLRPLYINQILKFDNKVWSVARFNHKTKTVALRGAGLNYTVLPLYYFRDIDVIRSLKIQIVPHIETDK
jgi:hypothetical protein